jgi:isopenicillin-N epimerase
VLQAQAELREHIEHEPVQFFVHELLGRLDEAREAVAAFVGAAPEHLVFVRNITHAVNSVLRSLELRRGDELLATDHTYNACKNVLDHVAARSGARVVVAALPFPVRRPDEMTEALLGHVGPRTRLALIDHVTSPTGVVLPIADIARALRARGVEMFVDGAHGPGMLPLELDALGVGYYGANFHKWVCAPKGAGMLYVRPDLQSTLQPAVISHGYNMPTHARSRFHWQFDWPGTDDPTPWLCVPEALRFVGGLLPGGWPEVRSRNHAMVLEGRRLVAEALGVELPVPDGMIGSLASLPLPDGSPGPPESPLYSDALQSALFERHRVEVPVVPWPAPPRRLLRLSAHVYNGRADYEHLASALVQELGHGQLRLQTSDPSSH